MCRRKSGSSCTTAVRCCHENHVLVTFNGSGARPSLPLSLSQLEARSGYSRRALQRAFQQRFGCGPMQWSRRRRLELALEQLTQSSTDDSVSVIARRCGYLSLASFSRDFGNVYGRRPSEILNASQQRSDS